MKIKAFGSDPELIIYNEQGKAISAVGLVPGSKHTPYDIGNGCSVQTDNVMVEFCLPPTKSVNEFHESLKYCIDWVNNILPQGHTVQLVASEIYNDDQLQSDQAKEFGCEPDFNAWKDGEENTKPSATNKNLRTCGGHLHVSYDVVNFEKTKQFVRMLDLYLGLPFLLIDPDDRRRELYGKAGAYRPKSYGFEYRVLSNYWLTNPELTEFVFNQVQYIVENDKFNNLNGYYNRLIPNIINGNRKAWATKIIEKFEIPMPAGYILNETKELK